LIDLRTKLSQAYDKSDSDGFNQYFQPKISMVLLLELALVHLCVNPKNSVITAFVRFPTQSFKVFERESLASFTVMVQFPVSVP
jgi:hypothetical protein